MRTANTMEALAELGDVDMFVFHDRRKPEPRIPAMVPISSLVTTGYPMARRFEWRPLASPSRNPSRSPVERPTPGPRTNFSAPG